MADREILVIMRLSFLTASVSVFFHPRDIVIHPVLEKFLAGYTDVAGLAKQSIFSWINASGCPSVGMFKVAKMLRKCCANVVATGTRGVVD